jgi:hypothetical protein|tara:strand:+ start:3639 stop:4043 length:405 start_codon:yes stop_codon:yes gene_type:complete
MEKFITRKRDGVDITHYGLKDYLLANDVAHHIFDVDVEDSDVIIDWSIDLEMREWGVKGIYFGTSRIVIELDVNIFYDEDSDDVDVSHKIVIDTDKDETWDFEDARGDLKMLDAIMPRNVIVDFEEHKIEISYE